MNISTTFCHTRHCMLYCMKTNLNALTFVVLVSLLTFTMTPVSNAATRPAPKVGNCYNLTKSNVAVDYSDIAAINCLKTHSAETYRVVKLKAPNLAVNFDLSQAIKVCSPWKGNSKFFNYWAWYIPNPAQQKAGQNWIRCDAMITSYYDEETGDYEVTSWKGKRLDIR